VDELRLQDAFVFLAAAGLVIPVMKRVRLNPILGFLLIGLVLGPHGLARLAIDFPWLSHVLITDVEGVRAVAELGVVFLLFMIGIELSIDRLVALHRLVFGLGTLQILVTALIVGAVAHAFDNSVEASIVLGLCLALSSTAFVVQLLTDQGRFGTAVGRGSFAILLAQDLAVVPILLLVGALGDASDSILGSLAFATLGAAVVITAILLIGRRVVRPLFRMAGSARSPEVFMAATLLLILGSAVFTDAVGLSPALGAFIAGLLIAETEYRHEIHANIEPFKGLLLGLFFISIGMYMDLGELFRQPALILMSVVGLFTIKAAVVFVLARAFRQRNADAVEMGLLLGEGGEFAFAIIGFAASVALLPEATAQFMLLVVTATLFVTPAAARFARAAARRLEPPAAPDRADDVRLPTGIEGHVVIAGYGRLGRLIADILERQRIGHVAVDLDVERVAEMRAQGAPVFVGDASRATLLHNLKLDAAAALVVTMNDAAAAERVVAAARALRRDLPILARARDNAHAVNLMSAGATRVVPEVVEAGLQLGHLLLDQVGVPADASREIIELERSNAEQAFDADVGRLRTAK
jgi:CPA2 family monovalent cation:H+ antiporter-2